MGNGKDLTTAKKQKITKLFTEGMSTLEISKELSRDHRMIKKAIKNITKLRTQSKGKRFKNIPPLDEYKLKQITEKQSILTRAQVTEKAGIEGVKMD